MKQTALNLNLKLKKTRKQVFLEQMEQVVPWAALVELIAPYYPDGKTGSTWRSITRQRSGTVFAVGCAP